MELEIIGYDENNEPIYQELLTEEEIGERLRETPEGKAFLAKYDLNDEHNSKLFRAAFAARLDENYSLEQARNLLGAIVRAGGVFTISEADDERRPTLPTGRYEFIERPVAQEPESEPEVSRDRNGRPLTEAQIRWSEYTKFAHEHSSRECDERAKNDAGFASFRRTNLRREMTEGGIGDSVQNLNAHPEMPKTPSAELVAWVAQYHRTPNEEVRKLKRADFNPTGFEAYNRNLQEAIDAGLI